MAEIDIKPFLLSDVDFTLGTDDYSASCSQVELAPNGGSIVTWKGLKPGNVFSFPTEPTWQVNLNFAQDFETANSLSLYLFENFGERVPFTFAPKAGGGHYAGFLFLAPTGAGGTGDSVASSTVSLGCDGKPTWVPAGA